MQSYVYKRLLSYSFRKSISRVFYHDNSRRNLAKKNPTTLQDRFIKYLEESLSVNNNITSIDPRYSITSVNRSVIDIRNKFDEQNSITTVDSPSNNLSSIISDIQNLKNVHKPFQLKKQLNIIDEESCGILNTLSFEQTLSLLNKLLEIVPAKLAGLNVYTMSIRKLKNMLFVRPREPDKIVNLLFLASLTKRAAGRDVSIILKHLPDIKELSLFEKCIVSVATFKAGVKLNRNSIQDIEDTIVACIDILVGEPGLFVSLVKALRLAGPSWEISLDLMSKRLVEIKHPYEITAAVPILALYAEALKPETNILKRLIKDSISDIMGRKKIDVESKDETEYLAPVRVKDVNRLLWATSRLNFKLTTTQLDVIEEFIDERLEAISKNPQSLAGILLFLWMLKSKKCRKTVEYCFQEKIFEPLINASEKDQKRLNLLLECVRIEASSITIPSVFTNERKETFMKGCRQLETVSELLKCLEPHLDLQDTEIDSPIKAISLYGISTRHETLGKIHIDILNNTTCLRNTRKPHGLMDLKLRLVKKLGYYSILLKNDGAIRAELMLATIEEHIKSQLKLLG